MRQYRKDSAIRRAVEGGTRLLANHDDFEESTDPELTEHAFDMLQSGDLLGEVISSDGVVRSRVWGPCPGCGHFIDDRQTHTAVTGVSGGELRGTDRGVPGAGLADSEIRYYQVDISCRCSNVHAGAPPGREGCGASFRVELEIRTVRNNTRP
jgi:hypothetical protein